nr:uncharacterized protein CFP56_55571 [Quercus suber]
MWKLGDDMKIIEVGKGLLQFKFSMESQLMWVWNNEPWCFDNHLLALQRWEKGMSVRSLTFSKQPFWIQVWGLPFDLINEEAGSDISRSIGELVEVDCKAFNSNQFRFQWIRVEAMSYKSARHRLMPRIEVDLMGNGSEQERGGDKLKSIGEGTIPTKNNDQNLKIP